MTDAAPSARIGTWLPPWWLLVLIGVLSIVAGFLAVVWPGPTLLLIALTFGVYLLMAGGGDLAHAMSAKDAPGSLRALYGVLGLVTIIAGILLIIRPDASLLTVAWIIGIWFLVGGILQLARGLTNADGRLFNVAFGLIGVIAGLVVVVNPDVGLVTLIWIVSIGFFVRGMLAVAAGLQLRRVAA